MYIYLSIFVSIDMYTTGTALRGKLIVKDPKLLFNPKFLCHMLKPLSTRYVFDGGDRFETIILYISDKNRRQYKRTHVK
jgi:hypothetical protein